MNYHYVYRITNIILMLHYYGTRTSKGKLPQEDIGIFYFSSSSDKDFINDQKENPQNYKYKVIRITNTRKEASELEILLHDKFNVGINENFYNRAKQTSAGFDTFGIPQTCTQEWRDKVSKANKGRIFTKEWKEKLKAPKSKEHKANLSISKITGYKSGTIKKLYGKDNPMYGKDHSDEAKSKISKANKGKILTEETKAKISKARMGIKQSEENKKKMSENRKGKGAGKDNGMVKTILIYNNNKELVFEVQDGFKKFCKDNKLPGNALGKSYLNDGIKLYQNKSGKERAKRYGFEEYIGWYAKIK